MNDEVALTILASLECLKDAEVLFSQGAMLFYRKTWEEVRPKNIFSTRCFLLENYYVNLLDGEPNLNVTINIM